MVHLVFITVYRFIILSLSPSDSTLTISLTPLTHLILVFLASLAPKQRLFGVASPIPRLCRIMKEPKHGGTRAVTSNMSYYMNFTAEFHSVMSEEATEASFTFNGRP